MTNFFAPCSRFGTPDELKDNRDVALHLVFFDHVRSMFDSHRSCLCRTALALVSFDQELIDTAHAYGLTVLMDLVHSHCSSNQSLPQKQGGKVQADIFHL